MQRSTGTESRAFPNNPEQPLVPAYTFDEIAEGLQRLRSRAGNPSYAEIVRRIAQARQLNGMASTAARPARTTVYDCFRTGRSRVSATLVGEIVLALTADEQLAEGWAKLCVSASAGGVEPGAHENATAEGETGAATSELGGPRRPSAGFTAVLMAAGVGLNLALIWIFAGPPLGWLHLPLFLDMIGTAICAMALGPWCGAAVGVLTNLGETAVLGTSSIPFALVQIVGALLWGYGLRRFGFGRTLPRYFLLHLLVALACTATATPILVLLFPSDGGHNAQITLINTIHHVVDSFVASVFSGNLFYSVIDKLIAGFAALPALAQIHARYPLPGLGALPSPIKTVIGGSSPASDAWPSS
jgi:energy-coupling factor transport system substrate-specific component